MGINVALVANKNTLKSAEHSTNVKLEQLEKEGHEIIEIKTSAFPVIDNIDKTQIKLLWLSTITYKKKDNDIHSPQINAIEKDMLVIHV